MAWIRFDPGFSHHPKRLKAGPLASWLWVASIDYCFEHLTDGFLPEAAITTLVPGLTRSALAKAIVALTDTRAWAPAPGGYHVHAFKEYQQGAAEIRRLREAGRERARSWREKKASRGSNSVRNSERNDVRTPEVREPTGSGTGAVSPLSPPREDSNGHHDWPPGVSRSPMATSWSPGRWPYHAFNHDCPEPGMRGRCVSSAYADAHPGDFPSTSTGAPKQCAVHRETSHS